MTAAESNGSREVILRARLNDGRDKAVKRLRTGVSEWTMNPELLSAMIGWEQAMAVAPLG